MSVLVTGGAGYHWKMPEEATPVEPIGHPWSNPIAFVFFLLVTVTACLLAYRYLLAPREVFQWDEAAYAVRGLNFYDDLRKLDLRTFIGRTASSDMMTYGFLHSWVEGVFFLVFGVSYKSARSLSLVLFFFSLVLMYLLALKLSRDKGWLVGILACVLMVSSPEALNWVTSNMLESLSVVLVLLATWFVFLGIERPQPRYFYLTGITAGLSFVTKHNYGTLLCLTLFSVGMWELAENGSRGFRLRFGQYLLVFLGFAMVITLWLSQTDVRAQIARLNWEMGVPDVVMQAGKSTFGAGLLAYPGLLREYTFSPLLAHYFIIGLFGSLWLIRDRKIRALLFFIIVPAFLTAAAGYLQARYIITMVPFLFIVAAFLPVYIVERLGDKPRLKWGVLAIVLFYLLQVISSVSTLPAQAKTAALWSIYSVMKPPYSDHEQSNLEDVLNFFHQAIPRDGSFSTAIRSHFLSPHAWRFHFHDWQAPHFTSNEIDDPAFVQHDYFVTIEVDEGFPYLYEMKNENRLANLTLWNTYLRGRLDAKSVAIYAMKNFVDLHVRCVVYRNLLSGASPRVAPPPLPSFLPGMKL